MRLPALLALLLAVAAWPVGAMAEAPPPPGVQPWAWDAAGPQGQVEVLVLLAARADLGAARRSGHDWLSRRRAVTDALRATAKDSQRDVLATLHARGLATRSFFTTNAVLVRADRALMAELAARPDVSEVVGNPLVRADLPVLAPSPARPKAAVPWGVARVGAPDLWAAGHDGAGLVIGGQDTGVRWTHEALRDHYRGWDGATATHDVSWHDSIHDAPGNPCGVDTVEPCDDLGHGSHTIGTAAGGTADEAIGVAPGARWIACRNMAEGWGSPARYLECFDWTLAPWAPGADPATGDPALGADVTVNSWVCPPDEGCAWDAIEPAVQAHRAAGIFTAASAGNSGPACGTVNAPPATYAEAFSVGASTPGDGVAWFSSRGPATDTGELKPDVVAPGVGVRSVDASSDTTYGDGSGTSMAGPHAAGAVAVLWSAVPALRGDVDATVELLRRTAVRVWSVPGACGGDPDFGPNATWGTGRIDLVRALAGLGGPPSEVDCADGNDDDGDGFADCADPDCAGAPGCIETGHCADRVDNDADGARDCDDSECLGDADCPESAHCADGLDNDLDGATDCDDRDCDLAAPCPALAESIVVAVTSAGMTPDLASLFAPGCRVPKWRACPDAVAAGTLPLTLPGEAAPTGSGSLRLYQHSDGRQDMTVAKAGADLVLGTP